MIPFNTFNLVSQTAHVLGGIVATLVPVYLWGLDALCYSAPISLIAAAMKEFWYDEKYETPEVRGSSLEDFIFYVVGITAACTLIGLKFASVL